MSRKSRIDWSKWDDLVGTMTDPLLAEQIGCSPVTVFWRRKKLGIGLVPGRADGRRTPKNRKIPISADILMGLMTDKAIADMFGTTESAVCLRRKKLGIPPLHPKSKNCKTIKWDEVDLSQKTEDLAKKFDVSTAFIAKLKHNHNIKHRSRKNWDNVDWGKKDAEIAKILGYSKQAVNQQRKKRNKGNTQPLAKS